ncbi:Serine/threonine-protein kinase Nek8 [Chionoecetes opilio]|uniref:Serine/threonine-protein kinase Nek8 n=1 Tax=Chionoecetes opilio TaxID=41210 RepID=A0A8J4XU49_CHIOP|nr:Serine/threonine-protein kinase Nek8 [Chionoecetes opilio]
MDSQDKMDDYKLVQSIGRGAYGYVYLYRRLSDGRLVVIKQLPMESISPEECEDVLHLFSQLVLGMQHIHESNILHRDIKSNNILLDKSHRIVKIGDFGISKILSRHSQPSS